MKADAYGLGAVEVVRRLAAAGCRTFYTATWGEARALGPLPEGVALAVLHGVRDEDMATALASPARPVLNSPSQVARWKPTGRPCEVMVDTGINRLGLTVEEARSGLLEGLDVQVLSSHLACADEPGHPMNPRQRVGLLQASAGAPQARLSLANSAALWLGADYAFDMTRPGLALYGGAPCPGADGIAQVVRLEAQVLQVRAVRAGEAVGYGAAFVAPRDLRAGVLSLGYADGLRRAFAGVGAALRDGRRLPLLGRVSMDQVTVDLQDAPVDERDWLELAFDLPGAAAATGVSQYELLTGLGRRLERLWS